MYSFIFDADALIKLTQSELIIKVCESFNCFITTRVKEETVDEGKKRFYPDADIIEKLVKNKSLKIRDPNKTIKIEEDFGAGELSTLSLYEDTRNHIIVSDDQHFINYLEKNNIDFIVPADVIILLKRFKKIGLEEGMHYLNKIRVFIREEVYTSVKKDLEED